MDQYPQRERKILERNRVLNRAADADDIPDPRFPSSGRLVSVRPTGAGLFAVAASEDEYFTPIPIAEADVRQYSVSVSGLVGVIQEQNGIRGLGDVVGIGMIPVGQKQVDGYGEVEVYLSLPNVDLREFTSRCQAMLRPVGTKKVAVLLPIAVRLPAMERQLLDAKGVVLIPLDRIADNGSLIVDWEKHVIGVPEDRPDGVYPPHTIVVAGREYRCDLNKDQMEFMEIAVRDAEIALGRLIHRGKDAFWRETFTNDQKTRNKVHQFLSRLNKQLANASPQFPFFFSLPRGFRSIVRDTDEGAA